MPCAFDQIKLSLAVTSVCAGEEARCCDTAWRVLGGCHGSRKCGVSYPAPVFLGVPEEVASLCGAPERGVKALGD